MRGRVFFLFLLLAAPTMGWSQSTLNFPKFFSAAELPVTGFAVVNPGPSPATVTFTLYAANGQVVSTSPQTVPAAGQKARSGTEIFTTSIGTGGWVQATSSTTGLQGFWLNYNGALTFLDGAEAAGTATDQAIPLVAGTTELNVANPNGSANSVTLRIFGEAGTELAGASTQNISANGVFQGNVAAIFPGAVIANARYLRVTGSLPVASTAVIKGFLVPTESAVVNGVDRTSTLTQANFPHVISGTGAGGNYTTVVGVTNLSGSAQTITISFTPKAGGAPLNVTRQLAPNGALRDTAQNIFSFNASVFQEGWIRVSGTAPLTGFVAYSDSVAGGLAVVLVQDTPRTTLLFSHIADLNPWSTGIALLNTNAQAATVEVYAMTPDGVLIGGADNVPTARFTIQPNAKEAKLLSELVPATQTRTSDGGFVFVRSNIPLFGIELFFTRNLNILSNVAAGTIAPGITFTPPTPPPGPPTLTSLSPTRVARGQTLTLFGSNFNTTPGGNQIVFTGTSGTTELSPTTSTSTSMTVSVPQAAITGPVLVRVSGQATAALILEVTSSATTLAQNVVSVSPGVTSMNADIYVAPPAGSLNATSVGVSDVGAASIPFAALSAEVARGQTKMFLVGGVGITQANGSTISFSGSGINITGTPTFSTVGSTTLMTVRISVDASAAVGPRNVIVTNANLDTAIVTGGVIIR